MLGLCLAYLTYMHPAKLSHQDESMRASAHILSLFLNNPLTQSSLPKNTQPTTPAKELTPLQIRLTSLETTLANLAKATTEVRKEIKCKPAPAPQTKEETPRLLPPPSPPTQLRPHSPNAHVVVEMAAYTWPDNARPPPAEICATINAALSRSNSTQVPPPQGGPRRVTWSGVSPTPQRHSSPQPSLTSPRPCMAGAGDNWN